MKKNYLNGGNSRQRRTLRRYLNREALPLVDANVPLIDVCKQVGVRYQVLHKHLEREGYIKSAWMYRRPKKDTVIHEHGRVA